MFGIGVQVVMEVLSSTATFFMLWNVVKFYICLSLNKIGMKNKNKYGKQSSLYLVSDDFFTVMKRHHTLLLFMAHYMSMSGSRLVLDDMMYDYMIKHVGINRQNIQRFMRELVKVGALKKAGVSYYIHPDIFYRGKWVDKDKFFFACGFDSIDKVISNYKKLRDAISLANEKKRKPKLSIVKQMK